MRGLMEVSCIRSISQVQDCAITHSIGSLIVLMGIWKSEASGKSPRPIIMVSCGICLPWPSKQRAAPMAIVSVKQRNASYEFALR